jgi:phosphatidylinositol dimannoside acyltransferase
VTVRGRILLTASWLACHLPERPLFRLAGLAGDAWYRLAPGRAAQARRNLQRVCEALAASGRGSPAVRAAATDPEALERLVRSAFRHSARYYLEVARNPAVTRRYVAQRLQLDTPDVVAEAVVPGRAVLFVGLHFGSVELASLFLAFRVGETVVPMETLDDPGLQAYFERTRGRAGIKLVGLKEARRELLGALKRGVPVGLVGDRDLTGGGTPIPLFGAPAIMPMGPAMLAVESGVPTYALTVRRANRGRYRGRVIPVAIPAEGTRRERVTTTMTRLAAAFEELIADAPDQWWAVFFPIWPDLEGSAIDASATRTRAKRGADGAADAAGPAADAPGPPIGSDDGADATGPGAAGAAA